MNTQKNTLIADVARLTGMSVKDTKIVVEEFLERIASALEQQRSIELRGFGKFYTKLRTPRPARVPSTGEVVLLKRRLVALFRYSGDLKKQICEELLKGACTSEGEKKTVMNLGSL